MLTKGSISYFDFPIRGGCVRSDQIAHGLTSVQMDAFSVPKLALFDSLPPNLASGLLLMRSFLNQQPQPYLQSESHQPACPPRSACTGDLPNNKSTPESRDAILNARETSVISGTERKEKRYHSVYGVMLVITQGEEDSCLLPHAWHIITELAVSSFFPTFRGNTQNLG